MAFAAALHSQTQKMFCQLCLISFQTLCIPSVLAQQLLLKPLILLSPPLTHAALQVAYQHSVVPLGFYFCIKVFFIFFFFYNAPFCCLCILGVKQFHESQFQGLNEKNDIRWFQGLLQIVICVVSQQKKNVLNACKFTILFLILGSIVKRFSFS